MNRKLTKEENEAIRKAGRSFAQRNLLDDILRTGESVEINRYMKSQSWATRYEEGFINAVERLKKELEKRKIKVEIKHKPGKNGGGWTSKFILISYEKIK